MNYVDPAALLPCPYCGGRSIEQGRGPSLREKCVAGMVITLFGIATLGAALVLLFFIGAIYRGVPYCNDCQRRIRDRNFIWDYKHLMKYRA